MRAVRKREITFFPLVDLLPQCLIDQLLISILYRSILRTPYPNRV